MGPAPGRSTFGGCAEPAVHAGAARNAARADDRLRQCAAREARRGAGRGPAQDRGGAQQDRLRPVAGRRLAPIGADRGVSRLQANRAA
ncbi:hypothetical protein VARIO8X_120490 [Burkholderiales bacterium 8X]|nr:hypothetical protein VARIO8X_120490 [Burkholderiales bacterium 8X]